MCYFIETTFQTVEEKLLRLQKVLESVIDLVKFNNKSGFWHIIFWIRINRYKAFKEIDDDFPENECLISKVYLNESIIYLFYKDKKYIVGLYSASYDNALLDVFFPNIYSRFSDMNNYDVLYELFLVRNLPQ